MRRDPRILALLAIAFGFGAGLWIGRRMRTGETPAWAQEDPPSACVAGDVNADGDVDISDPVHILRYLFQSGPAPFACPASAGPVSVVVVVRHAEKDAGDDPGLTEEGQARAEHLAAVLRSQAIDHLIASDLRRTQETLAPTSAAHGDLEIEIVDDAAPEGVAERIEGYAPGSFTVVAHHSYTIRSILEDLGLDDVRDIDVSGSAYDNFLVVLRPANEAPRLLRLRY